jgi:hypothetical protein
MAGPRAENFCGNARPVWLIQSVDFASIHFVHTDFISPSLSAAPGRAL